MSTECAPAPRAQRRALDKDGWRQACRIALAGLACLALAKLFNRPFGALFAVYPILLLGLVPVYTPRVVLQFVAASPASIVVANLLAIASQIAPPLAGIVFLLFATGCFRLMARGRWFLFGALCMVSTSILAHLGSYPQIPRDDLYAAQWMATLLATFAGGLAHALLPEHRAMPAPTPPPPPSLMRHQILLGAICATASYAAFQVLDLSDSLSAQAATVLILFPMRLATGRRAAATRLAGTLLGTACAVATQVLLYTHLSQLLFLLALYGVALLAFAVMHAREAAGPAVGLSAATAIAVLAGQLTPHIDLLGLSLYRVASVGVAVGGMMLLIFMVQALLNLFPASRDPDTAALQ